MDKDKEVFKRPIGEPIRIKRPRVDYMDQTSLSTAETNEVLRRKAEIDFHLLNVNAYWYHKISRILQAKYQSMLDIPSLSSLGNSISKPEDEKKCPKDNEHKKN